ncbi:hypothetical protein R4538_18250 [Vibrio cholerae]|nr:hypothetical protein R4538_18250 [Vibrio cholerae]
MLCLSFFQKFPSGLEHAKLEIIIKERKIEFTDDNLGELSEHRDLQLLFLSTNIDKYLAKPDNFALDDDYLVALLQSDISHENKIKIIEMIVDLRSLVELGEHSIIIGSIILNTAAAPSNIDGDIVKILIENSSSTATQIALFNKYHNLLTDDGVRGVLKILPKPYSEITKGYYSPRLENIPENQVLVTWLDSRKIISSWKVCDVLKDIKVNLYRS